MANSNQTEILVEMRGITKQFPGVLANDNVDFELRRGEIHTLLGENGAGKSTLMNILYGMYAPDNGEIYIKGKKVYFKSPADAIAHRIGMIHQHFMLIPPLTVVENVALGLRDQNPFRLDLKKVEKEIMELSEKFGLDIDPWAKIWQLSVGAQQRVEILKALYRGADVLIMDEPTAVLTPQEVEELFVVLQDLAGQGNGIIFISHKLWEVMRISNRVTILRDGRKIDTVNTTDITKNQLAAMMVGREVILQYEHPEVELGPVVLELQDVCASGDKGLPALTNVSFKVHGGEIVGIAGVDGNGQKELAEVIHGLRKVTGGRILLDGKDVTNKPPKEILDSGLGHIPEDRHKTGLVLDFSIAENMVLETFDEEPFTSRGWYQPNAVKDFAWKKVEEFDVRCPGVDTLARSLSGGNQQKIVLAREISRSPKLLVAAQPSRGLDVGATEFVQRRLIEERTKGRAVLLISTDLDEVLAVSDRVLVIYEGQIMGQIIPGQATFEEIGLLMAGTRQDSGEGSDK
nr:ABC transporter ATP-binding protein [Zhaonella formicivorans]